MYAPMFKMKLGTLFLILLCTYIQTKIVLHSSGLVYIIYVKCFLKLKQTLAFFPHGCRNTVRITAN
jgi:hypothetical protein